MTIIKFMHCLANNRNIASYHINEIIFEKPIFNQFCWVAKEKGSNFKYYQPLTYVKRHRN